MPSAGASDRKAWLVAGTVCILLVAGIAYQVSSDTPAAATPDMANVGSSSGAAAQDRAAGPAPDISAMTPRERFDRLYDRIMRAAASSDSAEVRRFTPMALGAYHQLEARDADARYHAAMLQTQVGEFLAALALADSILAESPGHLFGYLVRGEVASLRNDTAGRARARRDFLSHYETAMRSKRVEYLEHQPVVEEFKKEAEKPEGVNK